jgi:transposase-like protein
MNIRDLLFQDAKAARKWLEAQRWPNGVFCPHCDNSDRTKITSLKGKSCRPGLYACAECGNQFTVTVGTAMHRSKIPLNKWVLAIHLVPISEKGISRRQLQRILGITYQSTWSLCYRIREAVGDHKGSTSPVERAGKILNVGRRLDKPTVKNPLRIAQE